MSINFKKLKSQIILFKPEIKSGYIFIATEEQKNKFICSISKVDSKRSLIKILVELIRQDEDYKAEFLS